MTLLLSMPGIRGFMGFGTGGHDDSVRSKFLDGVGIGLLGESDDGAAVIELLLQIHAEATNIKLEVRTASSVHVAAESVALLPQLNAVADLGGILGRRHATGAAADNKQLSGMCSLFELVLTLGRSSGIYRAGGAANKWVAVVETLKAGAAEVYVVHSAVLDLAGPVGVGKETACRGLSYP